MRSATRAGRSPPTSPPKKFPGNQPETVRPDGATRSIPVAELHKLPGDTPHLETTLASGELITAVTLPKPPSNTPPASAMQASAGTRLSAPQVDSAGLPPAAPA